MSTRLERRLGYRGLFASACGVILVLLAAVGYYLYGQLRHAKLGLIDDHEILRFLGDKHSVSLFDIPRILLTQTEVGHWGSEARFRPVYYVLRLLEAAIHGDQAGQWYLTRIVLVVSIGAGVAFIVLRVLLVRGLGATRLLLTLALAAFAGLAVMTLPSWTDIVMRLGPSEIYVGVGIVAFAIGALEAWRSPTRLHGWIIAFVSYLVILGSKEDGLLFLGPFALLYLLRARVSRRRWLLLSFAVVAVVATAFVALGVLRGVAVNGGDIYGNGRSIHLFLTALAGNPYLFGTLLAFAVAVLGDVARDAPSPSTQAPGLDSRMSAVASRWPHATAALVPVFLVVGEAYFYQNYLAHGVFQYPRYGFVSEFSVAAAIVIALAALVQANSRSVGSRVASVAFAVVLLIAPPLSGHIATAAMNYRTDSAAVAASTTATFSDVTRIADRLRAAPGTQVVLVVSRGADYERVFSMPRFLRYYASSNSTFLRVVNSGGTGIVPATDPLSEHLVAELRTLAKNGKTTDGWLIAPYTALDPTKPIGCVYFGAKPRVLGACDWSEPVSL